ncbi:hypothetical protein Anas_10458 [Armadillidium nasatum]|uniref:SH3 domain-binding protein 5-like protein n=1 Tax=Armadillidium nasatum TaxID=96803 RepID=A0A5N5SRM0_9CRUS|nr:hypothetical protein Anas_10458 [Armadillidium nasatum]
MKELQLFFLEERKNVEKFIENRENEIARPYFELKAAVNQRLEEQKRHVRELETAVASAKANYAQALSNLETISDQIHKNRQSRLDLGIRGVGVGAESPGPPFSTKNESEIAKQKSVETPIEKTTSVLEHLSHCHDENTSSVTNPISDILPQLSGRKAEGETCQSTVSSKLVVNSSLEGDLKDSSSLKGVKSREDSISVGSNHTNGESGDQHGSYLSGWQFVAFPGLPQNASQSLLSVDDKESVVSDSESLTSIEMLSEEAIANLMLEDEINEASQSICSPHYSEEYLAPPFAKCGTVNHPFVLGITKKPEEKNSSQASSSDSGEQWEVVSDPQEQATAFSTTEQKLCVVTQEDPSIKADLAKEDSENHSKICVNSKSDSSITGNINDQSVERKSPNEANSSHHVSVILDNSDRPQTLPVNSQYLKGGVSSDSSSSLNSNSFSESFSPSYAPLSDTPDMDAATAENHKVEDMSPASSSNDQHNNV